MEEKKFSKSRRLFLQYGGAAAAVATVAGAAGAGFSIGRDGNAYTGFGKSIDGESMFFNRKPFEIDVPIGMKPIGEVTRPSWVEFLFKRNGALKSLIASGEWSPEDGLANMPGDLGDHFRKYPDTLPITLESFERSKKQSAAFKKDKHLRYAISDAYNYAYSGSMSNQFGSTLDHPNDALKAKGEPQPPEKWDFRHIWREKPLTFKSPAHATKLIKKMAFQFGAGQVAITKFDPRFMFTNLMAGMPNEGRDWGDRVPEHWKSIIVIGTQMDWDAIYGSIGYSTSYDGYFRSQSVVGLLQRFIKELGYPARPQWPGTNYEIMITPFVLLSGLGEMSRSGMAVIPEVGSNFRPAAVITNIEFEYDKPIDIKVADFCKKCKICADTCPSGAISFDDEPQEITRGFKRWKLHETKCYLQWCSGPNSNSNGCRVCIAVCPYTRKNTWIHTISREVDPRDPTGITSSALLAFQHNFFSYPKGEDFKSDWDGGKEASYHNPPWWMRSEDFFVESKKTWEYYGLE